MEESIKNAIQQAYTLVKKLNIKDKELKSAAFSKAFDFFILNGAEGLGQKKAAVITKEFVKKDAPYKDKEVGSFWTMLSEASGIPTPKLKDIYSLKNDQLQLIIPELKGKAKSEKRTSLAVLLLFAFSVGLNKEWVSSLVLAEGAKHYNLYDPNNFSKDLARSDYFRTQGKGKGLEYRLSMGGITEAKSYLKELAQLVK